MSDHAGAHVLVVEDEPDLSDLVRFNLLSRGYVVTTAPDGAEGLTRARTDSPDLILLDVMMPVLDGWQTLKALKSDPVLREIPVVMLTALSDERDLIQGTLSGAIEYITKPFDIDELFHAIEQALVEPDADEVARRRERTINLLSRLSELDSGRERDTTPVRLSKLENLREPETPEPEPVVDPALLATLTDKQRYVAEQLGAGRSARDVAEELQVSRSNIYATRKRIGRKLGVGPDEVPETARRMARERDAALAQDAADA